MPPVFKTTGNQTGYDLDKDPNTLYNPGFADSGRAEQRSEIAEVYTNHDISVPAKTTLGSYLSAVTAGKAGNSRSNSFYVDDTFNDTEGSGQTVSKNASSKTFPSYARSQVESAGATIGSYMDLAKSYDPNLASRFESTKDSQYSSNQNPFVGTDIKQPDSATRRKGLDGNSLLTNVRPTPGTVTGGAPGEPNIGDVPVDAPLVQKKISDVLRSNRFSPITQAFVQDHVRQVRGGYSIQRQMGVYDESKAAVNEDRLKEIGQLLMVRATGHDVPGLDLLSFSNSRDNDKLTVMSNTVPFLPSAAQLTGLPLIDTINLQAGSLPLKDTEGKSQTPRPEYINQENPEFSPFSGKSYGVLNSHFEPFGGAFPIGTLTTAIGNILTVAVFSLTVGYITQGFLSIGEGEGSSDEGGGPSGAASKSGTPYLLDLGRYGLESDSEIKIFIYQLLGIPSTKHPFGDAVIAGFLTFLGMGNNGNDRSRNSGFAGIDTDSILRGAVNLFFAPGYYASVLRSAVRDVQQVVQSVADIGAAGAAGQGLAAVAGFFKMIESIFSSSIFKFVMAMASLGDTVIQAQTEYSVTLTYDSTTRIGLSRITSTLTNRDKMFKTDIGVSDASNSNDALQPLAWKHSGTRSMYLLPKSFIEAKKLFGVGDTSKLKRAIPGDSEVDQNSGRITSLTVKDIEDALEAEYVPFYFHDLRTNEIISFHAFLSNLSDGFTANYTSTAGYGRTDEVMTYNSTKRSISVDFSVVATSKADMDVMYWNINKLISMLYPQFSRGRTMVSGDQKFIQPFSQIPTASPMIRLRVGDILKSNYSKFALTRLFGLGTDAFNPKVDAPISPNTASQSPGEISRKVDEIIEKYKSEGYRQGQKVVLKRASYNLVNVSGDRPRGAPQGATLRLNSASPTVTIAEVKEGPAARATRPRRGQAHAPQTPNKLYTVKLGNNIISLFSLPDERQYIRVPHQSIDGVAPSERTLIAQEAAQEVAAQPPVTTGPATPATPAQPTRQTDAQDAQLRSAFFGRDNNPIVRSFESTRGRGLAGFITDLKMDWQDATWEIDKGMRAPKFMKLSISFSPIHDMPLGLDSDGMMKSVAYNVGEISGIVGSHDVYDELNTTPPPNPSDAGGAPSVSAPSVPAANPIRG